MAVKKHKLVANKHNSLDLVALAQFYQSMNEQSNYLPPTQELVKHCHDILKCLSRTTGSEEQLWQLLQPVEEFLVRVVTVHSDVRHEIFIAILDKFYSYISDPQSGACPATAAVLVVFDDLDEETVLSAARWLVLQKENEPGGAGLRSALSCLYCWLFEWNGTPALGRWIIAYIKALEERERFDILLETTLDNIENLFMALANAALLRQSAADAIFHVLVSLRESTEAFDRISSHVNHVLVNLAGDSGQWSRQILQYLVDILTATVDHLTANLNSEAQEVFRDKYAEVFECLELHISSRASNFLQTSVWPSRTPTMPAVVSTSAPTIRKVGLINLGNTCYMNSVLQALLYVRNFSSHVVLKMDNMAYWSEISILFAKMMHSANLALDPNDLIKVVKPPFFSWDHQHDSSEFLGYLFHVLRSYEHTSKDSLVISQDYSQSNEENAGTSLNSRPVPPPSASSTKDTSVNLKRTSSEYENEMDRPPKKRFRPGQSPIWRHDSFIVETFGGSLVTRVECHVCHSSSLSRDMFLDLQLSFPEKTKGKKYSIQGLLEYYCSTERLSGDNKYQCEDCNCLRDAERNVLIEKTPKYLILVLKNFKFNTKRSVHTKLLHSISYNHTINLPTVRSQAGHSAYSLISTVIHSGTSIDSGHYYTLAKENDQWFKYDDEYVTLAGDNTFKLNRTCTPYILFYRRNDIEESPVPSINELPTKLQEMILIHNKEIDVSASTTPSRGKRGVNT